MNTTIVDDTFCGIFHWPPYYIDNIAITPKLYAIKDYFNDLTSNAIYTKCKPLGLVSNFYWKRYPEAAENLRQAWKELGWVENETIIDSFAKLRTALESSRKKTKLAKPKLKRMPKTEKAIVDYLNQFF